MSLESGRLTIVHISDVHATTGELLYGTVDGFERLTGVGRFVRETGITPEAVIITGDLAQRGHSLAYPSLNDAFRRLEDAVGAPVLTTLGNHDDPEPARVLHGHEAGHYRTVTVGPLRVVLLDSSSARLDAAQLDWLSAELAEPHGRGTIVALHHPPVPSPLPTMAKAGLDNSAELMHALVGTDTRIVLAGHFHHPLSATRADIPVSVGPSLAYHQVMDAGPHAVSGHDSAMFSLVHLTASGVSTAAVSLRSPDPLFTIPIPIP